jgi:hypothetical protein
MLPFRTYILRFYLWYICCPFTQYEYEYSDRVAASDGQLQDDPAK